MKLLAYLLFVTLGLGCATPIKYEKGPDAAVSKLAVVPFWLQAPLATNSHGIFFAEGAANLVTAKVLEALTHSEVVEVLPPEKVRELLVGENPLEAPRRPEEIGPWLRNAFGVDAVLYGTVFRFVPRQGGERGTKRAASVRFEIELRGIEGPRIWWGHYDETQKGVLEDLGSFRRALGRGFRWVTAESLAGYGAEQLVDEMIHSNISWR